MYICLSVIQRMKSDKMPRSKKADSLLIDRIKDKITISEKGCWIWGGSQRNGYASMTFNNKTFSVHRVSYTIHNGEIPQGLVICHKCDIKLCVNPAHLFSGTQAINLLDARIKGIRPTAIHGTASKYSLGCRCDMCKEANKISNKKYYTIAKNKKLTAAS